MDKATKTKIILFASLGIFVLVVLAVTLALTGKGDNREEDGSVNTSLRAQQQSDFTLDDMMNTDGRPEYENFTDEVYRERSGAMYREDPEVIALQEQLRQNQRADSLKAAAAMKRRTAKARPKKETPKKEEPERTVGRFFSGEEPENKGNTIEAIVSGDQKITNGSVIKLVTLQEMQLPGGMVINKGTAVFGVVKLAQDRINITVESVRIGNSIYEMQKTVYDRDGLPGIYVPLNIKAEATKEAADEVVSDMNVTSYGTDVLSTGVNAVSNAAKSVFRKKNNQAVTDFVAVDNPESVPNILRIKANRKSFSKQTTVSVATEGGFFYSFNVTYADSLEHTNYFLPDMSSIRPDTIYLNEVSQTHLIAPEKVIYIDYGDTCIQVSKAENTENIVRMIAATGKVEEFPRQTNVSLATEGGKFYTFNVDYRQQPEAFVYEIGEKRPEKKANVILTDNIIPAGERDQVMSRVYNAKRGIFNKGIVRNKIVFSVNNLHIYDNLLLFTFEIENKSKLPYDIDYIRYYIIDKKTAKLTASQEVDQQALFSENYSPRIEGNGRMKYVIAFDKFTIPDEKVFRIEINEKNGGRHVLFDLENSDIVNVEDI